MDMHYDVAIVGGGIAGFFAAIQLLEKHPQLHILLIEKNDKPLKKLLVTGSGACNFTHTGTIDDFLKKYGNNANFLRNAFYHYFNNDVIDFFESNGIKSLCREDGKYFPESMRATDIKHLFLNKTKSITKAYSCQVTHIEKNEETFLIHCESALDKSTKCITAKNLVITTGGCSFPKTGSTGDGFLFANQFGHTVVQPRPALAAVECKNHRLADFSGIAFTKIQLTHSRQSKKIATYTGSLLVTHKGISGPVIIDNSRYFEVGDILQIRFLDSTNERLEAELRQNQHISLLVALKSYELPKKLISFFTESCDLDQTKKICEISKKKIAALVELILHFSVEIAHIESFETCMVTAGGVSLKEVNPKTFESRLVPNLYFLGEVLDIDGDSGGYNLQAIFSECALFASMFENS